MAVAFDASTESVRTATTNPYTFTHTPVGTPRGVALAIVHGDSSSDLVSSVTYGGVTMSRVVTAADVATEVGRSYLYFLGASVPTGAQTVSITLTSATTVDIHFVAVTYTGSKDLTVVDSDSLADNVANPSVTLQYAGNTSLSLAALYGGGSAPSQFTPNANCTTVHDHDFGAFYSEVIMQVTPGSSDFAIGGTAAIDDVAYVAMAVTELQNVTVDLDTPNAVGSGTAAVSAPVPQITVPAVAAAATAFPHIPVIGAVTIVVAPAAAATAAPSAPLPTLLVAPTAGASTAAVSTPVVDVSVSAVATATAAGLAPSLIKSPQPQPPAALATASVATPDGIDVTVGPPRPSATAAVVAPVIVTVAGGATVVSSAAAAIAAPATPEGADVTVGPESANADAGINTNPVIVAGGASGFVVAPAAGAWATADGDDPLPFLENMGPPTPLVTVTAQATATAAAPAPLPTLLVQPGTAAATAAATGTPGLTVLPAAAAATATALAPSRGDSSVVNISGVAAGATASAGAPTPLVTISPASPAATAGNVAPNVLVTIFPTSAAATAAGSGTPGLTLTAQATATAGITAPVLIVPNAIRITPGAALATASASIQSAGQIILAAVCDDLTAGTASCDDLILDSQVCDTFDLVGV